MILILSIEAIEARCYVGNEDVVGAVPTGVLQLHMSDQQKMLLPTQVCLILEVLW